jgi:transcriptional regulator with XRE-family HTH domain
LQGETGVLYLRFLRLEKGLNQPALTKLSGVTQPTISLIECGRLNPTPDELERLGRALGVPPHVLMQQVTPDLAVAEQHA